MNESAFPPGDAAAGEVISVSALNRLARNLLERSFPLLRVSGEISNLARPASGHLYFTLKDEQAQVRCTMWRQRAQTLPFQLENGMRVEARALVTLYEPRGDFQLGIEGLQRAGSGSLFEAFARLKEKLAAEGLFDPAIKRPLPRYPERIAIVTSTAAAALQDVLSALRRRAPGIAIVLYPSQVQGEGAGRALTETLTIASRRAASDRVETLLLVRGGGSIEDLWGFNDEALARAIRNCPVPVISGVGHETDFTIADFVADLRATTPTMAAELVSAGYHAAAIEVETLARTLATSLRKRLDTATQQLDRAALQLVHPRERLQRSSELATRLGQSLSAAFARRIEREHARVATLSLRVTAGRPRLQDEQSRCARLSARLDELGHQFLARRGERLDALAARLVSLSPGATLSRGFSIVRNARGEILRDTAGIKPSDTISVELARGRIEAEVRSTTAPDETTPDTGLS